MKKIFSLIKACMTDNMSIFKIKTKNQNLLLPIGLFVILGITIASYASAIIMELKKYDLEYVLLTMFVLITFVLTLIEGIYKSSSLLFNCKDDDLLLSLPIKKSTVLFIRLFKFYVFELLYNSLFLLPAMVIYAINVKVDISYYIVSFLMLILLPIIPIVISSLIGMIISSSSNKFKYKNVAQIIITTILLLIMLYASFNLENIIKDLAQKASSINDLIIKLYYPAGVYNNLVMSFNVKELLLFIAINILLVVMFIYIFSNRYFKINSHIKSINIKHSTKAYKIKANNKVISIIKKEFNRFISSPVFVINAGFGLVLYIIACISLVTKHNDIINMLSASKPSLASIDLNNYFPTILFLLICFASLMSSITSSMISLEGKSFNILKTLPIKETTIIFSKVLSAMIIMLPFILMGDIIIFIKFPFTILQIILILISTIVLPFVAETIGIIINIKYPKMDADNDTEVVKQSTSSMVSVLLGVFLTILTAYIVSKLMLSNMNNTLIIACGLTIYIVLGIILYIYVSKKSVKEFNMINS